jgi:hypothetical protein
VGAVGYLVPCLIARRRSVEVVAADVRGRRRVLVVEAVLEVVAEGLPVVDQAVVVVVELVARARPDVGLDPVRDRVEAGALGDRLDVEHQRTGPLGARGVGGAGPVVQGRVAETRISGCSLLLMLTVK